MKKRYILDLNYFVVENYLIYLNSSASIPLTKDLGSYHFLNIESLRRPMLYYLYTRQIRVWQLSSKKWLTL